MRSEVQYYEWVGERRWNIHMKSNIVFKLPENQYRKRSRVDAYLSARGQIIIEDHWSLLI